MDAHSSYREFETARHQAGLTFEQLWLHYYALNSSSPGLGSVGAVAACGVDGGRGEQAERDGGAEACVVPGPQVVGHGADHRGGRAGGGEDLEDADEGAEPVADAEVGSGLADGGQADQGGGAGDAEDGGEDRLTDDDRRALERIHHALLR